jgi:hypothetical protein
LRQGVLAGVAAEDEMEGISGAVISKSAVATASPAISSDMVV